MLVIIFLFLTLLILSQKIGMITAQVIKVPLVQEFSKIPLGFFCLLGMIQLLYWPFMQFHLKADYLALLTAIFLGGLLIFAVYDLKAIMLEWKLLLKKRSVWMGLGVTVLLIVAYTLMTSLETYWDFNFYLPFIQSNKEAVYINTINPWDGSSQNLHWMYNYQSYYVFFSMLARLFGIDGTLLMIWLPSLLFLTLLPMLIFDIIQLITKNTNHQAVLFFILFCLSLPRIDFLEYPYYGVNFRLYLFMYLLIGLNDYLKTKQKLWIPLLVLFSFAHISTQSSALFISVVLMYGLFAYDVFYLKDEASYAGIWFSIPMTTYVLSIVYYSSPVISLLLSVIGLSGYAIIYWLVKRRKKIIQMGVRFMVIAIPLFIWLRSLWMILTSKEAPVTLGSFFKVLLEQCYNGYSIKSVDLAEILVVSAIITYLGYLLVRNKKVENRLFLFLPVVTVGVFFNPIVAPFVSSYLTGIVYERIFICVYSVIGICIFASDCLRWMEKKSVIWTLGLIVVSGLIFCNNMLFNEYPKWLSAKNFDDYDLLYKQSHDLLELQAFLNEELSDNERLLSTELRLRLGLKDGILKFTVPEYRIYETMRSFDNEDIYALYDRLTNVDSKLSIEIIQPLSQALELEYIVIHSTVLTQIQTELQSLAELIYENNVYQVYKLN